MNPFSPKDELDLSSTAGIDYKPLESLLRRRKWRAADQETFRILLKISDREAAGWLSQADVESLDCTDLKTIDYLWGYYSDDRFGFTQQQQLWEALGGTIGKYTPQMAEKFGDRVGWRKQGQWLTYDQLQFSRKALPGHLPATTGNGVSGGVWNGVASITYRLKYCPLMDALAKKQWATADMETLKLFEDDEDYCDQLKVADQLWVKYSNGRFGLSVQTRILKATGNHSRKFNREHYERFIQAVGWNISHQELHYQGADPKAVPQGHFPFRLGHDYATYGSGFRYDWRVALDPACGFDPD